MHESNKMKLLVFARICRELAKKKSLRKSLEWQINLKRLLINN